MKLFKWAFAVLVKRISRTFHPQHPPDQIHLHPRYPFQMYCAFIVDSCGDNAETINLSVTNNLSQRKENTPHMTFHEMTHEGGGQECEQGISRNLPQTGAKVPSEWKSRKNHGK